MSHPRDIGPVESGPQDRMARLSDAFLRIGESLDPDETVRAVLEDACHLTDASAGGIIAVDVLGRPREHVALGITGEEPGQTFPAPHATAFAKCVAGIGEPLMVPDLAQHCQALGISDSDGSTSAVPLLAAPLSHRGGGAVVIYLTRPEGKPAFSTDDRETLGIFAPPAAQAISNARRHRAEQQSRAEVEALVDNSPVGILVFDARTGLLRTANEEARRIGGVRQMSDDRELNLLSNLSVRRPSGVQISFSALALALAMGGEQRLQGEEMEVIRPDGGSAAVLVNAAPLYSDEGEALSIVATFQDMTPVEDLERSRTDFLAMVSHELRAPLVAIRGSATAVLDDASALDPAESRQLFRIILDQSDRMRSLINNLLDVARIDAGALPVFPGPENAGDLVDQARNIFVGGGGGNNLVFDVSPGLPPVMADRMRIVQVIGNLLDNASRHSPSGSNITVTVRRAAYEVTISVSDQGRGIPADRFPHLFMKFARDDADRADAGVGGAGLGLAICKGIVEAHSGRIWAESDGLNLGARFTFTLPVSQEAAAAESSGSAISPPALAEAGPGSARVLAIDDDPFALRQVRDALTNAGFQPVVTSDPAEVHRLMAEARPQLVLLDLMLPGIDGIELMQEIQRSFDVPVIFLSAYGREEVVSEAFEMGADDYVVKPFAPTELTARIRSALRRRLRPGSWEPYVRGDLTIDYAQESVTLSGRLVRLTATERRLLMELAQNNGRVLTHGQLLERVWGLDASGDARQVRTVVKNLRRKLGDDAGQPKYIFTESRLGYRMGA